MFTFLEKFLLKGREEEFPLPFGYGLARIFMGKVFVLNISNFLIGTIPFKTSLTEFSKKNTNKWREKQKKELNLSSFRCVYPQINPMIDTRPMITRLKEGKYLLVVSLIKLYKISLLHRQKKI